MSKPVSELPVMPKCCGTCPFKKNSKGKMRDPQLADRVIKRNFMKSQQLCHHPRIQYKEETHRCRGYFDHVWGIYESMGLDPKNNFKNNPPDKL